MRDHAPGSIPLKETDDDRAVTETLFAGTGAELRQFIERAEQLAAERADIADQEKELWAEAKGRGYSTKAMKQIVKERKRNPDDLAEEQAVLDLYKQALGMA